MLTKKVDVLTGIFLGAITLIVDTTIDGDTPQPGREKII
jgi:hypothetical protein